MALLWRAVHCIVPWLRRATSEKQYRYKGIEPRSPAEAQPVRAAQAAALLRLKPSAQRVVIITSPLLLPKIHPYWPPTAQITEIAVQILLISRLCCKKYQKGSQCLTDSEKLSSVKFPLTQMHRMDIRHFVVESVKKNGWFHNKVTLVT